MHPPGVCNDLVLTQVIHCHLKIVNSFLLSRDLFGEVCCINAHRVKKQTTKAEKTNVRTTKVLYLSDVLLIYKVRLKQCNEGENFASCEEEISLKSLT